MTVARCIAGGLALVLFGALVLRADNYQLYVLALIGLTAIVGVGLNVLVGLTGQISLGHVAFYAIGAYTVAILGTRLGWSFWLAWPLGALAAAAAGVVLAIPALRVRGPYLAMVTIAFGFVVEQGAAELAELTGGWNGIIGIPPPRLLGRPFGEREIAVLVWLVAAVALWAYGRLAASPWGKAMRAVRDAEAASQSIGLNPTLVRTVAFAISAGLAGVAGGIFAAMSDFISPESFPFFQSILFLLVVMIGGADRLWGPLVGAIVVVLLPEVLSALAQYRLLFVGLLLLVVLRLAPGGVVGLIGRLARKPAAARAPAPSGMGGPILAAQGGIGLALEGVSISFGGIKAASGISFAAKPGEITSVIGPNGAGKSTVLNLICGYYAPDAGQIRLGERDIAGLPAHRVAQAGVGRTYQTTQLFADMSVLDNILIAFHRGHLTPGALLRPDAGPDSLARARDLLAFVGFRGESSRPARELAHVDRRLVEIARALALAPSVLALDEPAAGLDPRDTEVLSALLRRVAGLGTAVILVEHDMKLVMGISDHVVVLDAGQKIAEGPPAAVARDELVLKAYLGTLDDKLRTRVRPLPEAGRQLLVTRALAAGYGGPPVIRGIDLDIREGELVAVLGANGAGKSTLMGALSGLNRPVDGDILLLGRRIDRLSAQRTVENGLVLVPEGRQVFPELTVADNIRLGAYARPAPDVEARMTALLERFEALKARAHLRAGLLSGGEQQMLAIVRGLIARPVVLMLDEPSLGLAPKLTERLYDVIAELREEGVTILLVDQMAAMALATADRAYVLRSGEVQTQGRAAELRNDPAVAASYLA
ncbi:MAG: branched-chain amino acid ABC transporter ATP-binding protein/permease [Hyphomicrobiaceae bacterium]|nr:branched-chain amino acid ABC transporter ATP-binding protein/permease [Hyphomicrobiaceae bacterium]